ICAARLGVAAPALAASAAEPGAGPSSHTLQAIGVPPIRVLGEHSSVTGAGGRTVSFVVETCELPTTWAERVTSVDLVTGWVLTTTTAVVEFEIWTGAATDATAG